MVGNSGIKGGRPRVGRGRLGNLSLGTGYSDLLFPFRDYTEKNIAEKDDNKERILSTLRDIETSSEDVLLQQLFAQLKVCTQPTLAIPWTSSTRWDSGGGTRALHYRPPKSMTQTW